MKKRLIAILTVMLLLLSSAAFAEDDGIARLPNKADELSKIVGDQQNDLGQPDYG